MKHEIKRLVLEFTHGESIEFCQYVADKVSTHSRARISEGGFSILYMPLTQEDEKHRGMEFSNDEMTFVYGYLKGGESHFKDRGGE